MTLTATIDGIGFWAPGAPTWDDALALVREGRAREDAPRRPSPQLLPPNERRRAPDSVAVALEVAQAACAAAGRDPRELPSVFASMHGDLAITDYMCATLASDPAAISPIKFHNSVHNAAAGYWTIGAGAMAPATSISSFDATFAQGLLEACVQLATGTSTVLLVGFDSAAAGPIDKVSPSAGMLGGALVLSRDGAGPRLALRLADGDAPAADGALAARSRGNAMAPMLPLFEALAAGRGHARLKAGPGRVLDVEIAA
ncbi:beta-ketoacyl synthase chain length factor [Lysobacter humi (ex Lee et al. 2017)]